MQLRLECKLTAEQYVSQRFWESASLDSCPVHPKGGCGLRRHGSYGRVEPPGARVARSYCPSARTTFSLLPDCLAARVKGTLQDIEAAADEVERHDGSLETLAVALRPVAESDPDGDHVEGTIKWLRRRCHWVEVALAVAAQSLPEKLGHDEPTLASFRAALRVEQVLVTLRAQLASKLAQVPAPLGFQLPTPRKAGVRRHQHSAGPAPPRAVP